MKEELKEGLSVGNEQSILVPFLVGGIVGAGIALMLAPKSGRELRKDIKDIASDTRDKITTTVEKGRELYVEGTAAVKNAIEAGKEAYVAEIEKHRKAA
jgi:gas vesicle protein